MGYAGKQGFTTKLVGLYRVQFALCELKKSPSNAVRRYQGPGGAGSGTVFTDRPGGDDPQPSPSTAKLGPLLPPALRARLHRRCANRRSCTLHEGTKQYLQPNMMYVRLRQQCKRHPLHVPCRDVTPCNPIRGTPDDTLRKARESGLSSTQRPASRSQKKI